MHPHKQYEEYIKLGYDPTHVEFFKIPMDAYCNLDFDRYQEMIALPDETREYYRTCFDPTKPSQYPALNWFRIPHILCQDPIDLSNERIEIIQWEDPIE